MNSYTALITGGNKGIGADLAKQLLIQGYRVISMSRNPPKATDKNLFSIEVDLLDEEALALAAEEVAKVHKVTHLIHNAGLIWPNLIEETNPSDIIGLAQLHLGSALTLMKVVLPGMKERQFGRVIFNGSRAALGVPTRTAYSATKAGIIGMSKSLAIEYAKKNITINCVSPGFIETAMTRNIPEKVKLHLISRIPMGKLGSGEDVSNCVAFLSSESSSYITGETIHVNGGMYMS